MKRSYLLSGLLTALAVFLLLGVAARPVSAEVEINAQQLKNLMETDDILVVFPLSLIEFNHMHIEGSVHIALENIPAQLPVDKNRKIAFYCLGRT